MICDAIDRIGSQIPQVFAAIDRAGGDEGRTTAMVSRTSEADRFSLSQVWHGKGCSDRMWESADENETVAARAHGSRR